MPRRPWLKACWSAQPASLPADDGGAQAQALGLAEHVWLAHLADPAGLAVLLARLPADIGSAGGSVALARIRWALALLAGAPLPALDAAPRWLA